MNRQRHHTTPRRQKRPLRAFPKFEQLLDLRWRINQNPEVCVRDRRINKFLASYRGHALPKISKIDGVNDDLATNLTDILTGYSLVVSLAPKNTPGKDLSGKPIKTSIPGMKGDLRLAYQRMRREIDSGYDEKGNWIHEVIAIGGSTDWLSPEPYRGKHLKAKTILVMVRMLTQNDWEQEEAFRVVSEAFACIGIPLKLAAVRKSFFRSC